MGYTSKTISLTLPKKLLALIDRLADSEMASRSEIIRQATIKHIRESGIEQIEAKKASKTPPKAAKDFEKLVEQNPFVLPSDHALLDFLDDQANNRL